MHIDLVAIAQAVAIGVGSQGIRPARSFFIIRQPIRIRVGVDSP